MGLFRLFETWCGFGEMSNETREREAKMMVQVLEQVKGTSERASLTTLMEDQRMSLEVASLKAMCALTFGSLSHASIPDIKLNFHSILTWIRAIFSSPDSKIHPIAHLALFHLLTSNPENEELWDIIITQCYSNDPEDLPSIGFFLVLANVFCQNKPNPCKAAKICGLCLYKIGHPSKSVRLATAHLVCRLDHHFGGIHSNLKFGYDLSPLLDDFNNLSPERAPEREDAEFYDLSNYQNSDLLTPNSHLISRPIAVIYKTAQSRISAKWADLGKNLSYSVCFLLLTLKMICEIFSRLDNIDGKVRHHDVKDMLLILAPWISNINLSRLEQDENVDSGNPPLSPVVNNCLAILFSLTVKYSFDFLSEIAGLWIRLFEYQDSDLNISSMEILIEYLMQVALFKKNPRAILNVKSVFIFLAHDKSFEMLMKRITPEHMLPFESEKSGLNESFLSSMNMIDSVMMDISNHQSLSRTQVAIIFISDMILQIPASVIIPHLCTILHVALIHIDHFASTITDDCISLLNGTLQALVLDLNEPLIPSNRKSYLKYEDITPPEFLDLDSVQKIKELVHNLVSIFSELKFDFTDEWADISFKWGINCPIRHIACRSLQIYRNLSSKIVRKHVGKLILRLSTIVGDQIPDVQGYSMECLQTLLYMLQSDSSIDDYLDVWWAGIALLYSPHIWEYEKGIDILLVFPERLFFESPDILDGIGKAQPKSIKGSSIIEKILQGLYQEKLAAKTSRIFNILASLPKSVEFLGDISQRLLYGILANVSLMMKIFDSPEESCVYIYSSGLCDLASSLGYDQLSNLLLSFSKKKFRTKDDFIFQLWSLLCDQYPSDIISIVSIMLKFTARKDLVETVLEVLLGLVRVLGPLKFASLSKSTTFWSPLINLIQTNASSPGLIALLDVALSKTNHLETDLKILFGKSKSPKLSTFDASQVRHNFLYISRHMNSQSHFISRNERLKRELEQVTLAIEEKLEIPSEEDSSYPEDESQEIDEEAYLAMNIESD